MESKRKRGFAIVLVAALASLIFLLGASLVVVSRLQTASANYDQRVRLAREHARAALDIAVAELQGKLGKDVAVSFAADVLRSNTTEDFKNGADTTIKQPFWTGADGDYWLVTQPLSASGTLPDPISSTDGYIELLGKGTVGDNDPLKVSVPMEAIVMKGVDGFTADSARTIGNYGYWVGDLGVKASYAWYDQLDSVSHDIYSDFTVIDPDLGVADDEYNLYDKRLRLRQMTLSKPGIDIVDTNKDSTSPTNPERIDSFVSDFQFRSDFGDTTTDDLQDDRFLIDLEGADIEDYFHDFTPLSKGLLVNSNLGGFKGDLSGGGSGADAEYNQAYRSYVQLATEAVPDVLLYSKGRFPVLKSGFPIRPALTQFNINFEVRLSGNTSGSQTLSVTSVTTVELWNPYSSAIDLKDYSMVLEILGIPGTEEKPEPEELGVWFGISETESLPDKNVDLLKNETPLVFEITSFDSQERTVLGPGEIVTLSGPISGTETSPYPRIGAGSLTRKSIHESTFELSETLDAYEIGFHDGDTETDVPITINVYLKDNLEVEHLVAVYRVDSVGESVKYSLEKQAVNYVDPQTPFVFGFSWAVSDDVIPIGQGYHPFITALDLGALDGFSIDSASVDNTSASFSSGVLDLLGYNPVGGLDFDPEFSIPVVYLPKQEPLNVGQLSEAARVGVYNADLGEELVAGVSNDNRFFDKFYFSSIPGELGEWNDSSIIPNYYYQPISSSNIRSIISGGNNPAESLYVHGMFNVHSTSIDAWVSLLKAAPVSEHLFWNFEFAGVKFLFMNHPLGGEDVNVLDPNPEPLAGTREATLASLHKNAFALSDTQVEKLASLIVKEIRGYVGADPVNPFDSLEEFVNSGVLQNAIDALDLDDALAVNPSWVIPGTPAEFRQSTILNLISGILSVRSDTFLVRAYGDAVDPADPTNVWAKAYCEAIVQRTHEEYGDDVPASTAGIDRKFEVVAFRWLSPSEI